MLACVCLSLRLGRNLNPAAHHFELFDSIIILIKIKNEENRYMFIAISIWNFVFHLNLSPIVTTLEFFRVIFVFWEDWYLFRILSIIAKVTIGQI